MVVSTPELLEFADVTGDETVLRLVAVADGRAVLAVALDGYASVPGVTVEAAWVRPLARWFAGDGKPADLGPGTRWVHRFTTDGGRTARVMGLRSWVQLACASPDGAVFVTAVRGGGLPGSGVTVQLTPGQRRAVSAWLSGIAA